MDKILQVKIPSFSREYVSQNEKAKVLRLAVAGGQKVNRYELICIFEYEKFEGELVASYEGIIKSIDVEEGQWIVGEETVVCELEASSSYLKKAKLNLVLRTSTVVIAGFFFGWIVF